MTLQDLQKELAEIFGNHFFQIAFYCDNRDSFHIGGAWIKIETDVEGKYRAWQVRGKNTFDECYEACVKEIREDLKK